MKQAALALLALATLAGCASTTAAPSPSSPSSSSSSAAEPVALPACRQLPDPVLPHSAGSLTEQQSGTYCLPRGQRADIFLSATQGSPWHPVQATPADILTPTTTSMMTAPMGVTIAMYLGATDGVTKLTSTTASGKTWTVTLVVKG